MAKDIEEEARELSKEIYRDLEKEYWAYYEQAEKDLEAERVREEAEETR